MTLAEWTPLYGRLSAGLGRKETPAQMRAYFDALSVYPVSVVTDAVKLACARTWPPTHPHAGEVREIAAGLMRDRRAPSSVCDVCHGDGWVIETLPPVMVSFPPGRRGGARTEAREWSPQQARRCYQCRPAGAAA